MKFSSTFTLVLAVLPCIVSVSALPQQRGQKGVQRGGQRGGQQGQNRAGQKGQQNQQTQQGQKGQQNQQTQQQGQKGQQGQQGQQNQQGQTNNGGQNNAGNGQAAGGQGGDPQTSLTLDPSVIAKGFAQDGQATPEAGQVPSLTSTNNFINFCAKTLPQIPLTNGQQIQTGSCNPAPIGLIPSIDNMPSSKFVNPANGANIAANTPFTISMAVKNLVTGNFVNAQQNYFAAPQQLNQAGQIVGHTHVVVEALQNLGQTTPTNPKVFAFFKGVNGAAQNGVVTADVDKGLPAGAYRLCSINTAANHQPAIVPVAQHGSLDDCVYFTAGGNGQNNGQQGGAAGTGTGQTGQTGQQGGAAGTGTGQTGQTGQQGGAAGTGTGQTGQQGQTQQGQKGQQGQAQQGQKGQQGQAQQGQKGQQGQAQQGQKGQQGQAQQGQKGQQGQAQQGQKAQPQPQPAQGQKGQQAQQGKAQQGQKAAGRKQRRWQ